MTKASTFRHHFLQLLFLPVLFVQYLFSFVLAIGLRRFQKMENKRFGQFSAEEQEDEEFDPVVIQVIEEVGREPSRGSVQVSQ